MRKFKRAMAIALTATMVLGSSLTAFAEETNTGNSTGAGTSEGHVDKKATNVVLPTIAEGSTPFAYTMDPERLIVATSHAKYGDAVEFPAAASDTGVYFNNGKKGGDGSDKDNIVYANTSAAQKVTNKSSHSIDLTVKAEAVAGNNDIPLVASSAIEDAEEASLYLGLKVGSETAIAVDEETAATKTVSIAGTDGNFDIFVTADGKGYEYRALTLAEYKALDGNESKTQDDYDATWKTSTFQLEGAVTSDKAITSTTTAPSVKVTWSWVDPSANAAPSIATTTYNNVNLGSADGEDLNISVNLGLGDLAATGIASVKRGNDALAANMYSFNSTTNTLTLSRANVLKYWSDSVTLTVIFAGESAATPTSVNITLNSGAGD